MAHLVISQRQAASPLISRFISLINRLCQLMVLWGRIWMADPVDSDVNWGAGQRMLTSLLLDIQILPCQQV
jgi:hypothetical protein